MKLECPKCENVRDWTGYPSDPILSVIGCRRCSYVGIGGSFIHHHDDGEPCSLGGGETDLSNLTVDDLLNAYNAQEITSQELEFLARANAMARAMRRIREMFKS